MRRFLTLLTLIGLVVSLGCSPKKNKTDFNNETNNNNTNNENCNNGARRCLGSTIQICDTHQWVNETQCGTGSFVGKPFCNPDTKTCVECIPGGTVCGPDNNVHTCTLNGTIGLVQTTCDALAGEQCLDAGGQAACDSPCLRAASTKSYRGCEYWAVGMANNELSSAFSGNYALVIDNNNDADIDVRITGGTANIDEVLPARTLRVYLLNYVESVRVPSNGDGLASGVYTSASGQGAFHIQTSLPVTVYQFNPYDFTINGAYSYTNDASLLLPVQVLSHNYMVMARPTWVVADQGFGGGTIASSPGVVAIVATEDNTTVFVQTRAYIAGGNGVPALSPGGSNTFALNKGDILQLVSRNDLQYSSCPSGPGSAKASDSNYGYCSAGHAYDPTGMMITSSAPVAVWGGHNCTFVPYNSWACDHLEEQMFPLETWGKRFLVGLTRQINPGNTETNVIRILASENNTYITFNPSSVSAPVTLNMGEIYEFLPPPNTHFEVTATEAILIGKFTVGQDYAGNDTGDPAFGLVVPTEQYRSEYNFTTPPSMTVNYVNVIAQIPTDSTEYIVLDDRPITTTDYIPIGSTGYGLAQIDVTNTGNNGAHRIWAPSPTIRFGIEVYGFASYTSYLYPGGLDLEYINPVD